MAIFARLCIVIIVCIATGFSFYEDGQSIENFKVVINERLRINDVVIPLRFTLRPDGSLIGDKGQVFTDDEISRLFINNPHKEYKAIMYIEDFDKTSIGSIEKALRKLRLLSDKKKQTIISLKLPEIFRQKLNE